MRGLDQDLLFALFLQIKQSLSKAGGAMSYEDQTLAIFLFLCPLPQGALHLGYYSQWLLLPLYAGTMASKIRAVNLCLLETTPLMHVPSGL